jgi:hypothetical protein
MAIATKTVDQRSLVFMAANDLLVTPAPSSAGVLNRASL